MEFIEGLIIFHLMAEVCNFDHIHPEFAIRKAPPIKKHVYSPKIL